MRTLTYAGLGALLAFGLAILILLPSPIFAQDGGTTVSIPWGDWLVALLANSGEVVLVIAGAALARLLLILPKPIADILKTLRVEQFLERAIDYGIEATRGAAKGKTLDINVGSAVVAEALRYLLDKAPGALIRWMGGEDRIREMILARLNLEATASASEVFSLSRSGGVPAPGPSKG